MEELGADVNARDHNGYTPVHHAAARGDNAMVLYLVEQGADVTAVARSVAKIRQKWTAAPPIWLVMWQRTSSVPNSVNVAR